MGDALSKRFAPTFFALGATSILAQLVFQREILSAFYGNEFYIGIILASWLAWTAAGSLVTERILGNRTPRPLVLSTLQLGSSILLLCTIVATRLLRGHVGFTGEVPHLAIGALAALAIPIPLCGCLGAIWTVASKTMGALLPSRAGHAFFLSRAYLIEVIGFILGGLLFGFLLVRLTSCTIPVIILLINLAVLAIGCNRSQKLSAVAIGLLAICALPLTRELDRTTNEALFRGQTLQTVRETPYGSIAVTQSGNQYNFFESGTFLCSSEAVESTEQFVHVSLVTHPQPKRVLLVGKSICGAVSEVLKHPVEAIDVAELDPDLIPTVQPFLNPLQQAAFNDPRVTILHDDVRRALRRQGPRYDVILLQLPPPSTLLINRFFTQEFLDAIKGRLEPQGLVAYQLPFGGNAPSTDLLNLLSTLQTTIRLELPNIAILPEEGVLIVASKEPLAPQDANLLIERFHERGIVSRAVNEGYIRYRLTTDRIAQLRKQLDARTSTAVNSDTNPIAVFDQELFWLTSFSRTVARMVRQAPIASIVLTAVIGAILLVLSAVKRSSAQRMGPALVILSAGSACMALEVTIIAAYQSAIGNLYARIAFLIAALMAGMALGVYWGQKRALHQQITRTTLATLNIVIAAFTTIVALQLDHIVTLSTSWTQYILLLGALIAGIFGGAAYPLTTAFSETIHRHRGRVSGIYAADLIGACLGALVPGVLIIPALGMCSGLLWVASLNLVSVTVLLIAKDLGREGQ